MLIGKRYYFREGDVRKWEKAYRESKAYLRIYASFLPERKEEERGAYKEAKLIVEEHRIFLASLPPRDKAFYLETVAKGKAPEWSICNPHPAIEENWKAIVLRPGKHSLADLDPKEFGAKLKRARIASSLFRAEAARYLGISDKALANYEKGCREPSVGVLFKMSQLFGADISALFGLGIASRF